VSEDRDALRAADVDREFVAERLREALNEGRLTLTEYDDRLQETYASRTYGDLKSVLSDLPTVAPASGSGVVPLLPSMAPQPVVPPRGLVAEWLWKTWSDWISLAILLTAIWLFTGANYYWPGWVIGITGVMKLAGTVNGLATGEPKKSFERKQRKAIERANRKSDERKSDEREHRRADRHDERDRDE
jgi:Domain of unknown function (DUF1707)